jgi:hypothetical protein
MTNAIVDIAKAFGIAVNDRIIVGNRGHALEGAEADRRCQTSGNALPTWVAKRPMRIQAVTAAMIAPKTAIASRQPSPGIATYARPSAA